MSPLPTHIDDTRKVGASSTPPSATNGQPAFPSFDPPSRSFFVPQELADRGMNSVHPFPVVFDDDKHPVGRRPAPVAWEYFSRLEINPPNAYSCITLDVDDVQHLPERSWRGKPVIPPTWIVQAIDTGKMHMGYILETPVHRNPDSLKGPLLKLADVADRLTRYLGADERYSGFISRNPLSPGPGTHVYWQSYLPYTLGQLDKRLPKERRPSGQRLTGIGRNVDLFRDMVKVAHQPRWHNLIVAEGWDGAWLEHVRAQNVAMWHPDVLPDVECRSIAKSCARYSLRNFDSASFADSRRRRAGKQWHDDYDFDFDTRNASILSLSVLGFRQREIAGAMGIGRSRVSKILRELTRDGAPEFWEPYT